jgi:hypothetical protein
MKSIKKGCVGYIKSRRIKYLMITLLLLGGDLFMFFYAKWYFGSNKNLFSLFAALICLPIAKTAVETIMLFRARGCSEEAEKQITQHKGSVDGLFELYLTSYSNSFQLSHVAYACGNVIAYTELAGTKGNLGEKHIREMLSNNGFKGYNVKIFYNLDKYIERLDSLNRLKEQGEEEDLSGLGDVLLSISL